MIKLKNILLEALPTKEIDPAQFPNPVTGAMKKIFLNKGEQDGDPNDDIVKVTPVSIPAIKLKASQDAIYLGKSLGMAAGDFGQGGDLDAVISKDNHILDGHHRWAATMFGSPTSTVGGYKAELDIGDLVPVLRALGDVFGNNRKGMPEGGDVNVFKATRADIEKAVAEKDKGDKHLEAGKMQEFVDSVGGMDVLEKRLKHIQKSDPPAGAPPRPDMPVIEPEKGEMPKMKNLLQKGKIDVREPYA